MRYAIYVTPPADSALAIMAANWLRYDIATARTVASGGPFDVPTHWIEEPSRYGFHATMKAPFRLKEGASEASLIADLESFCQREPSVRAGHLELRQIGNFLALVPDGPSSDLEALGGRCVHAFDRYRAPMTPAERARRLRAPLSHRELELLDRWGYPYVFECFRFHMTLTGALNGGEIGRARDILQQQLQEEPLEITSLSLCIQPGPQERFRLLRNFPLAGSQP